MFIRIELTLIDLLPNKGIHFPKIKQEDWNKKLIKKVKGNDTNPDHSFWTYERIL